MIFKLQDGLFHGFMKSFSCLLVKVELFVFSMFEANCRESSITEKAVIAVVDHILENDHSKSVAVIIKLLRLNFDMLSEGVETKGFCRKNVLFITGRGGRS